MIVIVDRASRWILDAVKRTDRLSRWDRIILTDNSDSRYYSSRFTWVFHWFNCRWREQGTTLRKGYDIIRWTRLWNHRSSCYCLTKSNRWEFDHHCPDISEHEEVASAPACISRFLLTDVISDWLTSYIRYKKQGKTWCLWMSIAFRRQIFFLTTVLMFWYTQSKLNLSTMKGKKIQTFLVSTVKGELFYRIDHN